MRNGWFGVYQSGQSKPKFDGCKFIVSFVGLDGSKARFIGVYRVQGRRTNVNDIPLPPDCPYAEWASAAYFYELTREPGYEDLENRVVIDWGKGALAWCQRLSNKEVVEILPKGQLRPPFRDYLEFTLTHAELVDLHRNGDANKEWRARLGAVAGVYLILAKTTGELYVGSAYGVDGIWGRWAAYASDGYGGNLLLKRLISADADYPAAFLYSILQILPKTFARVEVLNWEQRYKEKLGSRAKGLGLNT